ncbi:hypothetical protein D3C81_1520650 [compost metagenome]
MLTLKRMLMPRLMQMLRPTQTRKRMQTPKLIQMLRPILILKRKTMLNTTCLNSEICWERCCKILQQLNRLIFRFLWRSPKLHLVAHIEPCSDTTREG